MRFARSATVFGGLRAAAFDLDGVRRLVATGGCTFAVERFVAPRWRWSCEFRGVVVVNGLVLRPAREESMADVELFAQAIVRCVPETKAAG
ncbi:hypothetical protein [Lentzea sp. HUAS12]|uniref:hypothetical protein n=1 Tax=Lentzea sp. HUAS12 TaxID=2951806 RepID=UPI00209DBF61|nr:hypothetical protein [Lentzea sp. HUAS12]USX56366.1 hypothetical protein ND450_20365 [Lentzea sp. HUAS12]